MLVHISHVSISKYSSLVVVIVAHCGLVNGANQGPKTWSAAEAGGRGEVDLGIGEPVLLVLSGRCRSRPQLEPQGLGGRI